MISLCIIWSWKGQPSDGGSLRWSREHILINRGHPVGVLVGSPLYGEESTKLDWIRGVLPPQSIMGNLANRKVYTSECMGKKSAKMKSANYLHLEMEQLLEACQKFRLKKKLLRKYNQILFEIFVPVKSINLMKIVKYW